MKEEETIQYQATKLRRLWLSAFNKFLKQFKLK